MEAAGTIGAEVVFQEEDSEAEAGEAGRFADVKITLTCLLS